MGKDDDEDPLGSARRFSRQLISSSPLCLMPSMGLDPLLMRSLSVFSEVFEVVVPRCSLGLGFSIVTETQPFPLLIRIKRVFESSRNVGRLHMGDAILKANGINMVGLSVRQAIDVLRRGDVQTLTIARFTRDDGSEQLEENSGLVLSSLISSTKADIKLDVLGAFEVELNKRRGSLGFTLSYNESSSALRHTVKAIVKEPALSDGRIWPGDKLVEANGVILDDLDHQQLIAFLRSLPEHVRLKLYRDDREAQTPLSPSGSPPLSSYLSDPGPKRSKQLRFEAREMVRSRQASRSSLDRHSSNDSSKPYIVPITVETDEEDDDLSDQGSKVTDSLNETTSLPTVEAPETPVKEDFCFSLPIVDLCIEEIDDNGNGGNDNDVMISVVEVNEDESFENKAEESPVTTTVLEAASVVLSNSVILNRFEVSQFGSLPRPRHLDLSQRGQRRRRTLSFRGSAT